MAVIKSTDLDFDQIKANLKTYLQAQDEFADYDFEGSGLSNILDVLAYNTHYNGLIANMGINESFLNSAQLRSSVVSHAETLGYNIRSKTASNATVNVSLVTTNTEIGTATLPKNTTFTAQVDDISYSFQTLEDYLAVNDGTGTFVFKTSADSSTLPIYEGTLKTKTFIVGESSDEQVYVIPDENIDTSTLNVLVYSSFSSSTFVTYNDVQDVVRIESDSTVYIIKEVPNGYYELTFSDGNVLGRSPQPGEKIVVTYIASNGALANNAEIFLPDNQFTLDGVDYDLTVTTVGASSGGADRESIASIKSNAPRAFATQQRLITAEDYKALILQRYSSVITDVTSWGGNDNVPPIYGRVYVSLNFRTGIDADTQQLTKDSIVNQLSANLAVMSIDTVFSDPVTTYLEFTTQFDFDPDQTGSTPQTVESLVKATVANYVTNNLNRFNSVFRRSALLAEIDGLSPAILNSSMIVKVQQRFSPTLNVISDYSLSYPVELANPDDVNYIVTSTRFTFNDETCFIRNKLSDNKLEIVGVTSGIIQADNIGEYNATAGTVTIRGFAPTSIEGSFIRVSVTPANQSTIKPLRNYILTIDNERSTADATIDYQNTAVIL